MKNKIVRSNFFMKKILISIFLVSLFACNESGRKNKENKDSKDSIVVDSVFIKEHFDSSSCFEIDESYYPKFLGIHDKDFQTQLNDLFRNEYSKFIDSSKKAAPGCGDTSDSSMFSMPSTAGATFTVLTKTDNITSLIQEFGTTVGGGGNSYSVFTRVFNFDIRKRKILKSADLNLHLKDSGLINKAIIGFFEKQFPSGFDKENISLIKTVDDFERLGIGVRNDSTVIILQAWPTGHVSYGTYIIPYSPK